MARYLISEAARRVGVEAHVLRFWEEELKLEIPRNDQGHRCYTEEHMTIFHHIKEMKGRGIPLKEIKESLNRHDVTGYSVTGRAEERGKELPERSEGFAVSGETEVSAVSGLSGLRSGDKLMEFESILYDIVTEALRNNNEQLGRAVSERVEDKVIKEMNFLMRENEEHLEEHFRRLDEELIHRGRRKKGGHHAEAAATKVTKLPVVSQTKRKRHLFPRRRKTTIY